MAGIAAFPQLFVTPEKVAEALRRIIDHADPLQIIAFGSRARGDHRPESDLDLAVILDDSSEQNPYARVPYTLMADISMEVDLIVATKTKYDLHRPWLNSVFNYIDQEGVVLYDRENPERACPGALHLSPGRRLHSRLSAA